MADSLDHETHSAFGNLGTKDTLFPNGQPKVYASIPPAPTVAVPVHERDLTRGGLGLRAAVEQEEKSHLAARHADPASTAGVHESAPVDIRGAESVPAVTVIPVTSAPLPEPVPRSAAPSVGGSEGDLSYVRREAGSIPVAPTPAAPAAPPPAGRRQRQRVVVPAGSHHHHGHSHTASQQLDRGTLKQAAPAEAMAGNETKPSPDAVNQAGYLKTSPQAMERYWKRGLNNHGR